MPGCAMATCRNSTSGARFQKVKYDDRDKIIYHYFPKDENVKQKWITACKRKDFFNTATSRICSQHFTSDDYIRDLKNEILKLPTRKLLKPTAVPTQNLPTAASNPTSIIQAFTTQGPETPSKKCVKRKICSFKQLLVSHPCSTKPLGEVISPAPVESGQCSSSIEESQQERSNVIPIHLDKLVPVSHSSSITPPGLCASGMVEVVSDSSTDSTGIAPSVETEPVMISTEYNKDGKSLLEWLEMVSPKINVPRVQEKGVQTNVKVADPEKEMLTKQIAILKCQEQRLQRKLTYRDKLIADLRSELNHFKEVGYSPRTTNKCVKSGRGRKKFYITTNINADFLSQNNNM